MRIALCLFVCAATAVAANSEAAVLHVATHGVDRSTCGGEQSPCRSISQAISNAVNGDVIIVDPGRYGDANVDGDFNDSGDESAEVGFGCRCVVNISKAVHVESSRGAAMTVIDAPAVDLQTVIQVTASGAVFGRRNRGFLISPSPIGATGVPNGIEIASGVEAVTVAGNAVVGARGRGIRVEGTGHFIIGNTVRNAAIGLSVTGDQSVIEGNIAQANASVGGELGGSDHLVQGNVFIGNGIGFQVVGNRQLVRRNSFLGNLHDGLRVFSPDALITQNNIYGNVCGLRNVSGTVTDATNNFWGDSLGPGPDPAERI
jgi:hypothetical protein